MNAVLAMSSDEVRTADRETVVTDASAALLRTIAEVLDIRDVFPRVSAIVNDVLPHDALELVFLDRFDALVPTLLGFSMYGLGAFLQHYAPGLGTTGGQMLIWGFFISTVALGHGTFTINSLAHVFGRRRYETNDDSRNSFALAMVTLGEGWHNNHHHFPAAARNGFFWWEIDITYYMLKLLEACGIIWDLRQVPPELLDESLLDKSRTGKAIAAAAPLAIPAAPAPSISSANPQLESASAP